MPAPPLHIAAAYVLAAFFSCDPRAAPAVHFNYVEKDPSFVTDRATEDLRSLGPTLPNVNMADFPITSGIAQGKTELQTSMDFTTQKTLFGSYCLWPDAIEVTLTYEAQVYIARNYAPTSCRFALTREHEMRHVQTDEDVLRQFLPELKKDAEDRAAKMEAKGPFDAGQVETMKNLVMDTYRDGLTRELDKLDAERTRRQQQIDTPQEYTRLSAACPGEPLR
jgi:hypothetical protein